MELTLVHHTETKIHLICDGQNSHIFSLEPLQGITEQDLRHDPTIPGRLIYEALFRPGTRAHDALTDRHTHILLVLQDKDLDAIPWEYAYGLVGNNSSEDFLVLSFPFVRGVPVTQRIEPLALTQGMHIIAVPSNPISDTIEPLNVEAEWIRLREIVQEIPSAITLERTYPATLERLRQLLANQQNRIVHFMGHGGHNAKGATLCFEQENGSLDMVLAEEFKQRVSGTVFLVMLNACTTATPGPGEFSNLAASLVQQKIPYALGMRLSITDTDARTLSCAFYSELARGVSVEEALFQARLTLARQWRKKGNRGETSWWVVGVPVLYTALLRPSPGFPSQTGVPRVNTHAARINLDALPPVEGTFQGRISDLITLGEKLTGDQRPRLLSIHGLGGQGKTALARVASERFAWAWPGGIWAFSFESLPTRETFVIRLAQFLGVETRKMADLQRIEQHVQIRLEQQRTLIVLDNAEVLVSAIEEKNADALHLTAYLKRLPTPMVSMLITTQTYLGWSGEDPHELAGLSAHEGEALFRQYAPLRGEQIEPEVLPQLCRRLGGHPLSISLLARAFNVSTVSFKTFIEAYEQQLLEAEDKYAELEHRHRTLNSCFDFSIRSLDNSASLLLNRMRIFQGFFPFESVVTVVDPLKALAIFHAQTPESLEPTLPISTALLMLVSHGLVNMHAISAREGTLYFYSLLPPLRLYIKEYLELAEDEKELLSRCLFLYIDMLRWISDRIDQDEVAIITARRMYEDLERVYLFAKSTFQVVYGFLWGPIVYRLGYPLRALEVLEQALETFQPQSEQDHRVERRISNEIAVIYNAIGEPEHALLWYQIVQDLDHRMGNRDEDAMVLNNMGLVYLNQGQYQQALDSFTKALNSSSRASMSAQQPGILNNIALVHRKMGFPQQALQLYQQGLPIIEKTGTRAELATAFNNMATAYEELGQFEQALQRFRQALTIRREIGDRPAQVNTLTNMGNTFHHMSQHELALPCMKQALYLCQETNDLPGQGAVITALGALHRDLGQQEHALGYLKEALAIRRKVFDRAGEAITLNNIATTYRDMGKFQESLKHHQQALPICREVGDQDEEASTLYHMAALYQRMEQYKDALPLFEQALVIRRKLGSLARQTVILNNLAGLYQSLQRYDDARKMFEEYIALEQQLKNTSSEVVGLVGLAQLLYRHCGQQEQAIAHLEQAIAKLQAANLLQDASGQMLTNLSYAVALMRRGIPLPENKETSHEIMQAVQDFVSAMDTPEVARQIVETRPALLFRSEIEVMLEHLIKQAQITGNQEDRLVVCLMLLRDCKKNGIAEAFARFEQMMQFPFDPEIIPSSIRALLGSPQEKEAHRQYLENMALQTTEEGTKALIRAIQMALSGCPLEVPGQYLGDIYLQAWEAIVNGVIKADEN
jgi:tetratricopeptide (TPR) repeat protein